MSLGEKLRQLLEANGLEQRDLAKKLKVAPSSVSEWVTGKTHPRHKRLKAIAKILGTTPAELVA